jgi:hypothetical protein
MPFLVIDNYAGENPDFKTIDGVLEYFRDASDNGESMHRIEDIIVYEIVREVKIVANPATFHAVSETESNIPAPLPGETVSDYARRLTNG